MKAPNMNIEQLFQKYLDTHTANIESGYSALEVAGVLVSHGLMLYKTVLSDQDYNSMVDTISNSRYSVSSIPVKQRNLQ